MICSELRRGGITENFAEDGKDEDREGMRLKGEGDLATMRGRN
jgi:hypothetical protein